MRVLLVSQRYPPERLAGSELQVQLLAKGLRAKGVQSSVLTTVQNSGGPIVADGVPLYKVRVLSGALRRFSQWVLTWRHLARTHPQYDLVHCHCISPTSLAAMQFFRRKKVPVILQPSLGGEGGEFECARLPGLTGLINRLVAHADGYTVLDDVIRRELKALGVDNGRMYSTRLGVDLTRFRAVSKGEKAALRRELGLPFGEMVLFAGQFVQRKGVPELLDVWPAVRSMNPGAILVFVGSGPLEDAIYKACQRYPSIRCLGERVDVNRVMQTADVFAFPSHNESFGCVLAEAMACGLPVISGRTGIGSILPIDGEAGFVIDAGDMDSLRRSLLELVGDREMRLSRGRSASQLVTPYALPQFVDHVIGIYRAVLA